MTLKQARDAYSKVILENPSVVVASSRVLVNNGFGVKVPDPFGTVTTKKARVRLSYESGSVQADAPSSAGFSSNMSMFLTMDYHIPFSEGDRITVEGQTWRLLAVNVDRRFGGIIGATAALVFESAVSLAVPGAFAAAAGEVAGVELSWTDSSVDNIDVVEKSTDGITFAVVYSGAKGVRSYSDSAVVSGTTYYYRVKATNGSEYSDYTEVKNVVAP